MSTRTLLRQARGFSLVEVLVALVIIAVGMLGIAKMQGLALSSTGSAGTRSLVAIQAASLAASMHSNRDYWTTVSGSALTTTVNVAPGASPSITGGPGSSTTSCLGTSSTSGVACSTPTLVAAYDLYQWALALQQVVPGATATISCLSVIPMNCTITISWTENIVGLNAATAGNDASSSSAAGTLQLPQYTLYVEP